MAADKTSYLGQNASKEGFFTSFKGFWVGGWGGNMFFLRKNCIWGEMWPK